MRMQLRRARTVGARHLRLRESELSRAGLGGARLSAPRDPDQSSTVAIESQAASASRDTQAIREWAETNGHEISSRGRITRRLSTP